MFRVDHFHKALRASTIRRPDWRWPPFRTSKQMLTVSWLLAVRCYYGQIWGRLAPREAPVRSRTLLPHVLLLLLIPINLSTA